MRCSYPYQDESTNLWTFKNKDGSSFFDEWFDEIAVSFRDYAPDRVKRDGKYNFLSYHGKLVSDVWFDEAERFEIEYSIVKLHNKFRVLVESGDYLSKDEYTSIEPLTENVFLVGKDQKFNYLTKDGNYLSKQWFDDAHSFCNGFARVFIASKGWNYLNQRGIILSEKWFYQAYDFWDDGYAKVENKDRLFSVIDEQGCLPYTFWWFDDVFHVLRDGTEFFTSLYIIKLRKGNKIYQLMPNHFLKRIH